MAWYVLFILYILLLFVFLFMGYWVPFALGTTGLIGLLLLGDSHVFQSLGFVAWNGVNSFELTAIPLFILMGELILSSGVSDRFFHSTSVLLRKIPGGLFQTNIVSCGFFSAISGSSLATAAAVGSVSIPELSKRGYNRSMIYGSLGGGGALGILLPPSIPLIIYGSMVEESVAKLFMAGVVPGLLAILIFMIYIGIRCLLNSNLTSHVEEGSLSLKQKFKSIGGLLPITVLIVIIAGGIYLGYTTPTESAGLGVILSLVICAIYKKLTYINVKSAIINAVRTSSMVLFIVVGAQILSYLIVQSGINRGLTDWIISIDPSPVTFLFIVFVVYLILGCVVDGLSLIFLTLPVLWPLVQAVGFDPIWFGIVLVILIEVSQITPPVGLNLYVLQGIAGEKASFSEIVKGNIPYFFLYLFIALLVTFFPQIALWLPSKM
ncbi:TRAP transporter large permease [Lentibacillus sp. N15]|uniref:TRAP transporter large permease n=1 Tax=Lentibacillus songyuanensis TaxID=3136161 RepID=UPI0031BB1F0B